MMAVSAAHSVFGRPPMATKRRFVRTHSDFPVALDVISIRSSALSPSSAVTEDSYLTSTFGCDKILLVRYYDIDAESARSLTNIVVPD